MIVFCLQEAFNCLIRFIKSPDVLTELIEKDTIRAI